MARTIDLELTRAEVEVIELEARLRVVPMNDLQLSGALTQALKAKKERLEKLLAIHAAANRPQPLTVIPPKPSLQRKGANGGPPTAAKTTRAAATKTRKAVKTAKAASRRHATAKTAAKRAAPKRAKSARSRKPAPSRSRGKSRR